MITDYYAIETFRGQLAEAITELDDKIRQTEAAIEDVSTVWKDRIFTDFQEKFGEDKELLRNVNKDLAEFNEDVLYSIQEKVRVYLENRF